MEQGKAAIGQDLPVIPTVSDLWRSLIAVLTIVDHTLQTWLIWGDRHNLTLDFY